MKLIFVNWSSYSNLYFVSGSDLHQQLQFFETTQAVELLGCHLLLGVFKIKLEMVENQRNNESRIDLCKSFTKTNTFTAWKWCKSKWVTRLSLWGQKPRVIGVTSIKALRFESFRLGPLNRIMVNLRVVNHENTVFLKENLLTFSNRYVGIMRHGRVIR